jgi:hypothetical protein
MPKRAAQGGYPGLLRARGTALVSDAWIDEKRTIRRQFISIALRSCTTPPDAVAKEILLLERETEGVLADLLGVKQ